MTKIGTELKCKGDNVDDSMYENHNLIVAADGTKVPCSIRHCNRASGVAVLSHGITVDRHEEVMFDRLSDELYANAMTTLSFDFRGHGESQVPERGMTLTGQLLDLQAVIEYARSELGGPLHLLGSSFGAASTCLLLDIFGDIVSTVSLWNPVLDLTRTFLEPETIWSRENFSSEK